MRLLWLWPLRLRGNHFCWGSPWMGKRAVPCPFSVLPCNLSYNWGKARKISVRVAGSLDWPAEHHSSSFALGKIGQPLVGTSAFRVAELKGFPASANYEQALAQCFDVVGKHFNLQILVNFPFTDVSRCFIRNAKTLGLQHLQLPDMAANSGPPYRRS
jgi:hypothetical protein